MTRRVVITGLGAVTPLGNDVPTTWSNVIAGKSGASLITQFDATGYKTRFACEVKNFDASALLGKKEVRRLDRFAQFAVSAAKQALDDSGLQVTPDNSWRSGVYIGTGIGGVGTLEAEIRALLTKGSDRVSPFMVPMMLPDMAAAQVAIRFGLRGPNMAVVTACASGNNAIGDAADCIRRDAADVMLAGGAEAAVIPIAIAGFANMTAISTRNDAPQCASRPFDKERDGFVVGEGAAVVVLEELEHALARGARIYGELIGYGSTADAYHITAPEETGAGAAQAMRVAMKQANLQPDQIDYINAHGTSTPLNDKSETAALKAVLGETAYRIPVSSTKSMTGHLLGAAGAIEAVFCMKVIEDGIIPPTINYEFPDPECDLDYVPNTARQKNVDVVMSNSFGFGGHNAVVIFKRYQP
ncbi:MAG TPA: beta-ketoacyl-ACP synthase II [Anaerolineae bacterium]|nr:beta-ketoacyl-ACP synthase II [Anaerolineae bacterium]